MANQTIWSNESTFLQPFKVNWSAFLCFFTVSAILSSRTLIYFDSVDLNNLIYFSGLSNVYDTFWTQLVEEPLWKYYAEFTGSLLTPELALRSTIFVSSFGLLYYANKIGKEAWVFIFLIFIFTAGLSMNLYFTAIRQGAALTLFMVGLSRGFKPAIISSLLASLIHTSFVLIFLIIVMVWVSRNLNKWVISFIISLCIIVFVMIVSSFSMSIFAEYMGRRADGYIFGKTLNINYYIIWIPVYFSVILLMKRYMVSVADILLWRFVLSFLSLCLLLTFYFEAAQRLLDMSFLFLPLVIARGFPDRIPKKIAIFWILYIVVVSVYDFSKGSSYFYPSWSLVLFGR